MISYQTILTVELLLGSLHLLKTLKDNPTKQLQYLAI